MVGAQGINLAVAGSITAACGTGTGDNLWSATNNNILVGNSTAATTGVTYDDLVRTFQTIYETTDAGATTWYPPKEMKYQPFNPWKVKYESQATNALNWDYTVGTIGLENTQDYIWQVLEPEPAPRRIGGIYHTDRRRRQSLRPCAPNEERARQLLQRLVGFRRFARYIRDGFLAHQGKSGKVYQIFPGYTHMKVWVKGRHVESLCLYIKDGDVPPTDDVVMRLLMLEHSEEGFRRQANVWPNRNPTPTTTIEVPLLAG